MTSSASFKCVALLAVVFAGGLLGYKKAEVVCTPVDSPASVRAGGPATIRFLLMNKTGRMVKLRPRSTQCGARLEGVPALLNPGECCEIRLVVKTAGQNGQHRFTAAISTDANPRLVAVAADFEINADWVVRPVALGKLAEGTRAVRRVRIDNVPARNLVRVGNPEQRGWSASLAAPVIGLWKSSWRVGRNVWNKAKPSGASPVRLTCTSPTPTCAALRYVQQR